MNYGDQIQLLGLSGSLRQKSYNTAVLSVLKVIAPEGIQVTIADISQLPLFNPDLDESNIPALATLKANIAQSHGLVIASPEYAHGISGPLKNALDWLVAGEEFPYKPVMLVNTSPRAHHAMDSLKEVLRTMSATLVDGAEVNIPLLGTNLDADGIIEHAVFSGQLTKALNSFVTDIQTDIKEDHETH
jgi:chromate reductase